MKKIFIIFFFIFFPQAIFAQTGYFVALREIISNFDSVIEVRKDSTVAVTETIKVFASNKKIQHGIYRDFPTKYRDASGIQHSVRFEVVSVKLDGSQEQYEILGLSNGKRVRIGNPNEYVSIGWHSYEISYVTDNQLGFFDDHDELYWNVTGNSWEFPIEKATAKVVFPTSVFPPSSSSFDGYTGKFGAKEKYYTARLLDSSTLYYETTQALAPQEGLTIVVGWPKGFVHEPTQVEKARNFFIDNFGLFAGIFGIFLGFLYYLLAWSYLGKDPKKGIIIPQYEPPMGMSPAEIRYLVKYNYDNKVFSSAILQLAVKGFVTIKENKKIFGKELTVTKTSNDNSASEEEKLLLSNLFLEKQSIVLGDKYHAEVQSTSNELKKYLKGSMGSFFEKNLRVWFLGLFILIGSLLIYLLSNSYMGMLPLYIMWFIIFYLGIVFFSLVKNAFSSSAPGVIGIQIFVIIFYIFIFIVISRNIFKDMFIFLPENVPWNFYVFFVFPIGLSILFYFLLRRPTTEGRRILDHIEGFKWFLEVTEKDRMNFHNPPEKTPELFEKYLAYALALGVEHKWSEQFSKIFGNLEREGRPYQPLWYSGVAFHAANMASFGGDFGKSLNHAISASSTRPGSSSGFGGGGSSGGGGGGGGGGGW